MKLPFVVFNCLRDWANAVISGRDPNVVIRRTEGKPYLKRWYVIPRNPLLNIYIHVFCDSDRDVEHHDHPWPWVSVMLRGGYAEERIAAGGVTHRRQVEPGAVSFRLNPRAAHRVILPEPFANGEPEKTVTLFITGPRVRRWGFHSTRRWIDWKHFVACQWVMDVTDQPDATPIGQWPVPETQWRHVFTGKIYKVQCLAVTKDRLEAAIVYSALEDAGQVWTCSLAKFCDGEFEEVQK